MALPGHTRGVFAMMRHRRQAAMHNNLYEIVESSAAEDIVAFEDVRTYVYIYLIITRQLFCKITCC